MPDAWLLERPLYDVRFDAYWLVTRDRAGYYFTGPVNLSREALNLLPVIDTTELPHVKRYLPCDEGIKWKTYWAVPYHIDNQEDGA